MSVKERPVDSPERLAERFFAVVQDRDRAAIAALLHPQVSFAAKTIASDFEGREDVLKRFYDTVFAWTLYDAFATDFEQLSNDTVRVRGRLRWMNNGHLRDVAAIWTLTFEGGQLSRLSSETITENGAH